MITKILFCITVIIIVFASIMAGATIIKSGIESKDPVDILIILIGLIFIFPPLTILAYILGI